MKFELVGSRHANLSIAKPFENLVMPEEADVHPLDRFLMERRLANDNDDRVNEERDKPTWWDGYLKLVNSGKLWNKMMKFVIYAICIVAFIPIILAIYMDAGVMKHGLETYVDESFAEIYSPIHDKIVQCLSLGYGDQLEWFPIFKTPKPIPIRTQFSFTSFLTWVKVVLDVCSIILDIQRIYQYHSFNGTSFR